MSDYDFDTRVSRDQMAAALGDSPEQTPYVLAELAEYFEPGTMGFDDFCDFAGELNATQKEHLLKFCMAVANALDD